MTRNRVKSTGVYNRVINIPLELKKFNSKVCTWIDMKLNTSVFCSVNSQVLRSTRIEWIPYVSSNPYEIYRMAEQENLVSASFYLEGCTIGWNNRLALLCDYSPKLERVVVSYVFERK